MRANELLNLAAKKLFDKCITYLTEDERIKLGKFLGDAKFCGVRGFKVNRYACYDIFFDALRFYNFNIDFLIKNAIYSETYMYERWKEIDIQQILYKIKPITDFFYEKTSIEKDTKLTSIWKDAYKEDIPSNMLNKNNSINVEKFVSYNIRRNTTLDGQMEIIDFITAIRNVIFSNQFNVYRQSYYKYSKINNYYYKVRNNKKEFFYHLMYDVYHITTYNVNNDVKFYMFFLNNYAKTYRCFDIKSLQKFYNENENWFK